jgi:hypothetical protein
MALKQSRLIAIAVALGLVALVSLAIVSTRLFLPTIPTAELPPPLETAWARVAPDDLRKDAIAALSDAWFHGTCNPNSDAVFDVFLYGSHEQAKAQAILLQSRVTLTGVRVEFISGMEQKQFFLLKQCLPDTFTW